jgi:hypothetical protein
MDSTFYCEAFFCFFDFDNNNVGKNGITIAVFNDDLSVTLDTIEVDATLNTVVLDSAVYIKDLVVVSGADIYMQYRFWGEYETRENRVFLLTKYKSMGYDYFYCGIFGSFPGGNWNLKTLEQNIEYVSAFWPIPPTRYENKFWKKIYSTRY